MNKALSVRVDKEAKSKSPRQHFMLTRAFYDWKMLIYKGFSVIFCWLFIPIQSLTLV